jgi:HAE1 family hydrophobic/amphiphilic exporter-1
MNLSDLSIKNPVFAVMLSAAMIVFGYLGYRDMGVSQFPEIDFPVISISIRREGAPPDIMDGDVTDVVEDAVAGVEGVDYIMSKSLESASIVTVYFRLSRPIDAAMTDIQNAVTGSRRRLPKDIDEPVIAKVNPNTLPVMWLTLSASTKPGAPPVPLNKIGDFAEKEFKQQLAAIPEVGGIQFGGLQTRNIVIHYNAFKLAALNKAPEELGASVVREHIEMPAGIIEGKMTEANFRIKGEAGSVRELGNLVIARRDNQPIYLKDVAVIEDGTEEPRSFARFCRMPSIAVGIRKAIGGNLVAVCDNVKKELPRLERMLPPGVELHMPVDYSVFIRENVDELKLTLFLGILLTAGVCFLFLGSVGTTLNICLSIPTSLVGTFFFINHGVKMFGMEPFTINLMTLLALSLSVGVVVDDAILVLENIYRHREQGKGRREAALLGAREISFAAIAATLSIMAIFLPVAFMTGTIGKFFFQFGVTVGVAVFLSLICALTLTPMLCAFFLSLHEKLPKKPMPFGWPLAVVIGATAAGFGIWCRLLGLFLPALDAWSWPIVGLLTPFVGPLDWWLRWPLETLGEFAFGFALTRYGNIAYWALDRYFLTPVLIRPTEWALDRLTAGYAWLLRWSLRYWPIVITQGLALIALAFVFIYFDLLGRELTPSEDQSRFIVHVVCPVGSSLDYVSERLSLCEQKLQQREDVASFLTTVATEPGQLITEADIFVQLVPQHERRLKQKLVMADVRADLEKIPDIRVVMRDQSTEGFTAQRGDPVDFAVQGDWKRLPGYARDIMEAMKEHGGVQDIDSDYRPGMPEVRIFPSRDKLAMVNMTMAHLATSLSQHVGGQRIAMYTDQSGGRRYDLRLRGQWHQRSSPDQLKSLLLRSGDNRLVPLGDVADIKIVSTLPVITRYNHQRKIEITASPDTSAGISQGEAIARCQKIAEEILPQSEFRVVELGNAQAMGETIRSLVFALILGIVIAYMILGVQFNSFVHPFTVLLAMPFAATGALVTLWLTGDTLNMMSMIGLILLMGLVKKNSIILVDYTNKLREEGKGLEEAVLAACPIRLRPILMTSVATVAGAIPAAIGLGPGAETRAPMARGIIGGILLSTLVTLILVPVFYVLIERLRVASRRLLVPPALPPLPVREAQAIRV